MGTDIHFTLEKRVNPGEWIVPDVGANHELWDTIEQRNYDLFACIADVRNYNDFPSMDTYKTRPEDLSWESRDVLDTWDYDTHCYYATLKEFYDFYIQQPKTFIQSGILVGEALREFKQTGKRPFCWCRGYYGPEESELCEWEEDYHPMDSFMTAIITLSYLYYQQIVPLEDIRTSPSIKAFVRTYGDDIRGVFCFDS